MDVVGPCREGFAIGSAVLTALSLMNAYVKDVPVSCTVDGVLVTRCLSNSMLLTDPVVMAGLIIGAMLPFVFAALTMLSVRKAAGAIIVEVQRQFRTIPGLLEGKEAWVTRVRSSHPMPSHPISFHQVKATNA